ncbi:MAG: hypothetical protein U0271_30860 [Polyangiaceae bacterium]
MSRRSVVFLRVLAVVVFGLSVCPVATFAAPVTSEVEADLEQDTPDLKEPLAAPRTRLAAPTQSSRLLPTARLTRAVPRAPHVTEWLLPPQRKTLLRLLN